VAVAAAAVVVAVAIREWEESPEATVAVGHQ